MIFRAADEFGFLRFAALRTVFAAGMEGTSFGEASNIGRRARNGLDLPCVPDKRRRRIDEPAGIRMQFFAEQGIDVGIFHDTASIHDRDVIGSFCNDPDIVRQEQERRVEFLVDLDELIEDIFLCDHVERRRRLVQDDEARAEQERECDHHALLHAARHLMGVRFEHSLCVQLDHIEQLVQPHEKRLFGSDCAVIERRFVELIVNGHKGIERALRRLKHHGYLFPAKAPQFFPFQFRNIQVLLSVKDDFPLCDLSGRRDRLQQRADRRGLAASALAHERRDAAAPDIQGEIGDCP